MCTFSTSERQKVVRTPQFFDTFDLEMCFGPQRRALFRHLNFKKCSEREVFLVCLYFKMCFAPQRRALFRHLNFQKWSEVGVPCTFWLGNVLRATTACTFATSQLQKMPRTWGVFNILTWKRVSRHNRVHLFDIWNFQKRSGFVHFELFWFGNVLRATRAYTFSTSQLPKAVRSWCALCILTSKRALRHNGVQLFISHLASWLRTRRFSEVSFRPSGAPNHWKNTVNRDFPTFSRTCIFSLLTFSISYLLTSWLLLPDSSHLCFNPYCRKFDF